MAKRKISFARKWHWLAFGLLAMVAISSAQRQATNVPDVIDIRISVSICLTFSQTQSIASVDGETDVVSNIPFLTVFFIKSYYFIQTNADHDQAVEGIVAVSNYIETDRFFQLRELTSKRSIHYQR